MTRRSKAYPAGKWRYELQTEEGGRCKLGWFKATRRSTIDTVTDHIQRRHPDWKSITIAAKPGVHLEHEKWLELPHEEIP